MLKSKIGIKKMILRHRKEICLCGILLMVMALVLSINLTARYRVLENHAIVVNCIVDLLGMLFALVLFFGCFSLNAEGGQVGWCFETMVLICFFMFFCNDIGYIFSGHAAYRTVQMIVATVGMFITISSLAVFWEFFVVLLKLSGWRYRVGSCIVYPIVILDGIFLVINCFAHTVFTVSPESVVNYLPLYNIGVCLTMVIYATIFILILITKCSAKIKIMLSSYVLLPGILLFIDTFNGIGQQEISYDSLVFIGVLLSLNINFCHSYVEQGKEMLQQKIKLLEQKQQQRDLENAIMLSQIQPHFIYNSLATISHLCKKDAVLAKEAVDKFAEYLRENTKVASEEHYVSFAREMEHTETYLWLEQLRFGDSLKVEYDIEFDDFMLPPLSLQPLVENAVKYGIRGKEDGGTVRLSTHRTPDGIQILIEDDGAGFDPTTSLNDGKFHVGISNARERIKRLCGGTVHIESKIGQGTRVTILLPEETKNDCNHS